jgi:hypothetical protein
VDGDSATGFVEDSPGWRELDRDDCGFTATISIAKGTENCRLSDIHTLWKSVDFGGLEHVRG